MKSQKREEGLLSALFLKFLNLQEAVQDVLGDTETLAYLYQGGVMALAFVLISPSKGE